MEINTYDNIYSLNLHKSQPQNGKPAYSETDSSNSSVDLNSSFGTDSVELSDQAREILFKSQESEEQKEANVEAKAAQTQENPEQEKEEKQIKKLEARDREVRVHEQQHKSVGGAYAGPIHYDFQTGPDGKRYAVGGHVMFNVGAESTPEASIRKADVIYKAALAPAEPSSADHNVAQAAMKLKQNAQAELQEEKQEKLEDAMADAKPSEETKANISKDESITDKIKDQAQENQQSDSSQNASPAFGFSGPQTMVARSNVNPIPNII